MKFRIVILLLIGILSHSLVVAQTEQSEKMKEQEPQTQMDEKEKLVVVWTSGDPEVAKKMVYMYVYNAKKNDWWKDITFIIWGPSSKLLSENEELQEYIQKMMDVGVNVEACKACADLYGVSDDLSKLGIDVRYLGKPLTEYIKSERHVITF